ncbi:MAG: hypothetical protein IKX68_09815 [Clostridiales bacterium]|nr:hypothetical protein [Clostridiales bacterium]
MGIFDRRKEADKEKAGSPLWVNAYVPSYNFDSDKNGNPAGSFTLNEGVATRLLKKPNEFYPETPRFLLLFLSTTDKKIIGMLPYDKALKALEPYQLDETKEEVIIRPLSYSELTGVLKG